MSAPRLARDLHPAAWWAWAIGLAAAASFTTNPVALLLLVAAAWMVVLARRSDQPWSRSFRVYLALGATIVVLRVAFRLVLGGGYPGHVLLDLPTVPLPSIAAGITVLGPITREALLSGLYDGLRLGTIVVCIGAANALANPKRLLRSVPPALYEIGTALVVAVTIFPQLADSVRRVRAAQSLRAGAETRLGRLRRFLVPVLEDALDRSLALAAGMDVRGYGRAGERTPAERRRTGALLLLGLMGLTLGVYTSLDATSPAWASRPLLLLGVLLAAGGLVSAGRSVQRTRYRPDPWGWPETAVALSGVGAGWIMREVSLHDVPLAYPAVDVVPTVSLAMLVAVALVLGGGLVSPPARRAEVSA